MLNTLPKITTKAKKRIGHGIGSGKGGHTSTRGMKGQKARRTIYPLFEGTKNKKSLIQRLPLQRGKGKQKSLNAKFITVNISQLNVLPEKSTIDVQTLIKNGIVSKEALKVGVKILSGGDLSKALILQVQASKSALEKIKKAGGTIPSAPTSNQA